MTTPVLLGPPVTLRPFTEHDVPARQRHGWHRDIELNYGHECETRAMSDREAREWWDAVSGRGGETTWAVEAAGELVGTAFLHDIREHGRTARYAIGMYSPSSVGIGLGSRATRLVLRHAFDTLGLHRVDLRVLAFNEVAVASYRRCGFVVEGRERESCWVAGRWHDDIIMGVLESDFRAADGR